MNTAGLRTRSSIFSNIKIVPLKKKRVPNYLEFFTLQNDASPNSHASMRARHTELVKPWARHQGKPLRKQPYFLSPDPAPTRRYTMPMGPIAHNLPSLLAVFRLRAAHPDCYRGTTKIHTPPPKSTFTLRASALPSLHIAVKEMSLLLRGILSGWTCLDLVWLDLI